MLQRVAEEQWGQELVGAWDHWIDLPYRVGDKVAEVVGASAGEVVIADSTTVNLFKLGAAALASRPGAIVTERGNFPSDLYVVQALANLYGREIRLFDVSEPEPPSVEDVQRQLDTDVALVTLSHTSYKTGAVADMAAITAAAHQAGALVLWDLSHSAGSVPVALDASGADLAVGCCYKYLNGGPGAPAFLFVRRELQDLVQPVWGWFGQRSQFEMTPTYEPAAGMTRFLTGTPPIVSLAAIEPGVDLILEARLDRLAEKSTAMTAMMIELFDSSLAPVGVGLASPRDPGKRGSHVSFRHPEAFRICKALIAQHAVVPDFREPDVVRFGVPPIYTRFTDAWDAIDRLRSVVEEQTFASLPSERTRIT